MIDRRKVLTWDMVGLLKLKTHVCADMFGTLLSLLDSEGGHGLK